MSSSVARRHQNVVLERPRHSFSAHVVLLTPLSPTLACQDAAWMHGISISRRTWQPYVRPNLLPAVTLLPAMVAPLYSSRALPGQPAACLHQPPWSETLPAQYHGALVSHTRLAGRADRTPLSVGKRDVLGNTRNLPLSTFSSRCTEGPHVPALAESVLIFLTLGVHVASKNILWRATVRGHCQSSPRPSTCLVLVLYVRCFLCPIAAYDQRPG